MKTRHTFPVTVLAAGIALASGVSAQDATDFSGYTTDELVQMRSQVRNMSEEDQIRYRTEMQQRSRDMTPEQRAAADMGPQAGQGAGQGQGQGEQRRDGTGDQTRDRSADQRRDGSGAGQGRGRKKGGGSESSSNFGTRSSYGSGYQSRQGQGGGRGGRGGN